MAVAKRSKKRRKRIRKSLFLKEMLLQLLESKVVKLQKKSKERQRNNL